MAILNTEGRPSATQSKERYLTAVRAQGFEAAHLQMLSELKARLDEQYRGQSHKIAEQADLIEGTFVSLAIAAGLGLPLIAVRDQIFGQVFGQAGK